MNISTYIWYIFKIKTQRLPIFEQLQKKLEISSDQKKVPEYHEDTDAFIDESCSHIFFDQSTNKSEIENATEYEYVNTIGLQRDCCNDKPQTYHVEKTSAHSSNRCISTEKEIEDLEPIHNEDISPDESKDIMKPVSNLTSNVSAISLGAISGTGQPSAVNLQCSDKETEFNSVSCKCLDINKRSKKCNNHNHTIRPGYHTSNTLFSNLPLPTSAQNDGFVVQSIFFALSNSEVFMDYMRTISNFTRGGANTLHRIHLLLQEIKTREYLFDEHALALMHSLYACVVKTISASELDSEMRNLFIFYDQFLLFIDSRSPQIPLKLNFPGIVLSSEHTKRGNPEHEFTYHNSITIKRGTTSILRFNQLNVAIINSRLYPHKSQFNTYTSLTEPSQQRGLYVYPWTRLIVLKFIDDPMATTQLSISLPISLYLKSRRRVYRLRAFIIDMGPHLATLFDTGFFWMIVGQKGVRNVEYIDEFLTDNYKLLMAIYER